LSCFRRVTQNLSYRGDCSEPDEVCFRADEGKTGLSFIVLDLLPLYHDGACSNDNKTMVEEHLVYCDSCKAELQAMEDALFVNNAEQNLQEAEAVKKLSKRWKKGMLKSLLKGILITILAIALIALVLYCFMDFRIIAWQAPLFS